MSEAELTAQARPQQDSIIFSNPNSHELAWLDIKTGLDKWKIWCMLAYQDIKLRYRRSFLGPFWITISMAVTVYAMGFLYAHLFRTDIKQYYPFLVAGMLAWTFISSTISDLVETFMNYESLIKQIKLPYSLYIHRIIARNFIVFFHNIWVMVPIYIIFHQSVKINLYSLFIIPGLFLTYLLAFNYGLILAMIGARFRDVAQIIRNLIQVIFFVTPVMWSPMILSEHSRQYVYLNPFYSFLEMIRAPLMGTAPTLGHFAVTLSFIVMGSIIAYKVFVPYRSRIIYWL